MNLEDLSPELRDKARECKTADEILELARQEGFELTDEQLDSISGGKTWHTCHHCTNNTNWD